MPRAAASSLHPFKTDGRLKVLDWRLPSRCPSGLLGKLPPSVDTVLSKPGCCWYDAPSSMVVRRCELPQGRLPSYEESTSLTDQLWPAFLVCLLWGLLIAGFYLRSYYKKLMKKRCERRRYKALLAAEEGVADALPTGDGHSPPPIASDSASRYPASPSAPPTAPPLEQSAQERPPTQVEPAQGERSGRLWRARQQRPLRAALPDAETAPSGRLLLQDWQGSEVVADLSRDEDSEADADAENSESSPKLQRNGRRLPAPFDPSTFPEDVRRVARELTAGQILTAYTAVTNRAQKMTMLNGRQRHSFLQELKDVGIELEGLISQPPADRNSRKGGKGTK